MARLSQGLQIRRGQKNSKGIDLDEFWKIRPEFDWGSLCRMKNSKFGYRLNLTIIQSELTKIWSRSTTIRLEEIP
jgi:hypothetical protein